MAGAVLRPAGSSSSVGAFRPIWRSCSATRKRCASLAMKMGASDCTAATRSQVACNGEASPSKGRNCLGYALRESGHKRVPEPPTNIIGRSFGDKLDI